MKESDTEVFSLYSRYSCSDQDTLNNVLPHRQVNHQAIHF